MDINPEKLYEELLGPEEDNENHNFKVSDRLIDLVIHACDIISEQVNMYDNNLKIEWLLDQGFTPEEIKEFVGRTT
ncbi:MAG: hypothetical protein ACXAC5_04895 [Promethearchaeota archaeon]